ncbi:hypothetical protein LCGC14_2013040 [marine sediment metagenome]|uniref:Uncharacterized protein n=1 Tax=marine sediment metagenome TaxID=412755 RepID=A0A0F9HWZ4_9ZZZZ
MIYAITVLLGTLIMWLSLLIIVPIAQKLADFAFPPWSEALWKLAVIAGVCNVASVALDLVHPWLALVVGAIIFWVFMVKWFQIDFFGAVIIVVVSWIARALVTGIVVGALVTALG